MCDCVCVCGQEGMGAQLGLRQSEGVENSFVCLQRVRKRSGAAAANTVKTAITL